MSAALDGSVVITSNNRSCARSGTAAMSVSWRASSSGNRLSTAYAAWHRQLAERHERRLFEEILERGTCAFGRVHHASRESIEQRARREVDHHDFVGLFQDPVRNRFAD